LLLFFSSAPEHAVLEEIPDDILLNGMHSPAEVRAMDIATKCRYKREALFDGSLLQTMHPAFFHEHFMKHPVVHINLSKCKGGSLDDFVINLCCSFAAVIEKVVDEAQHGRYILLIDEYDIPFITIRLAEWSKEDKGAAWGILKLLFQKMLKDNHGLLKGLLVGVFEIPLTEMGSGANNVKDIRLVPAEENDIQSSILSAARPHSGSGLDALTDSFWFNANEVGLMLDNSAERCPKIRAHKDYIMTTIREWYNGYYIGRFRGKYNPWSVSSFIESLCNLLDNCDGDPMRVRGMIKSAARPYWVTTGTTGLIDAQIERHRVQFIPLAKRLIRNFEDDRREECCSSPPAPTPGSAARARGELGASRNVPLVSTRVNLAAFDNDRFSEPGLLTLCLYAGYLTRQQSTSVCIPNYEVYEVWLQLFARAVMGAEMADNSSNCERGALLKELWCGKTDQLCKLATSSHGVLSNHNGYLEHDYANHVANTIMAVSRFGVLTHPWQKTNSLSHVVPMRENHAGEGRCDYTARLFSTENRANQFGLVIEFKLIPAEKRGDHAFHKRRAREGLEQIAAKNYDACLTGCLERMDVGMAIGNSTVYALSKLYRRATVDDPWEEVPSLV
ncbi:hypothetical protein H4R21_002196, partial [Coemansia helicoidea]